MTSSEQNPTNFSAYEISSKICQLVRASKTTMLLHTGNYFARKIFFLQVGVKGAKKAITSTVKIVFLTLTNIKNIAK